MHAFTWYHGLVHRLYLWPVNSGSHFQLINNHLLQTHWNPRVIKKKKNLDLDIIKLFMIFRVIIIIHTHTSCYEGVWDLDVLGFGDMNSISVRAILWCAHCDTRNLNVRGFQDINMDLLSIFYRQLLHYQIVALVESHSLQLQTQPLCISIQHFNPIQFIMHAC